MVELPDGIYQIDGDGKQPDPHLWDSVYGFGNRNRVRALVKDGKVIGLNGRNGVNEFVVPEESRFLNGYLGDFERIFKVKVEELLTGALADNAKGIRMTKLADGVYRVPGQGKDGQPSRWRSVYDEGSTKGYAHLNIWAKIEGGKVIGLCGVASTGTPSIDSYYSGYVAEFERAHNVSVLELLTEDTVDLPDGDYLVPGDGKDGDPDRWSNGSYDDEDIKKSGFDNRNYHWAAVKNKKVVGLGGNADLNNKPSNIQNDYYLADFEKNRGIKIANLLRQQLKPTMSESTIPDGFYLLPGDGKQEGDKKLQWPNGNYSDDQNGASPAKWYHYIKIYNGKVEGICCDRANGDRRDLTAYDGLGSKPYIDAFQKMRGVSIIEILEKQRTTQGFPLVDRTQIPKKPASSSITPVAIETTTAAEPISKEVEMTLKVPDGVYLLPGDGKGEGEKKDQWESGNYKDGACAQKFFHYIWVKEGKIFGIAAQVVKFSEIDDGSFSTEGSYIKNFELNRNVKIVDLLNKAFAPAPTSGWGKVFGGVLAGLLGVGLIRSVVSTPASAQKEEKKQEQPDPYKCEV